MTLRNEGSQDGYVTGSLVALPGVGRRVDLQRRSSPISEATARLGVAQMKPPHLASPRVGSDDLA